MRYGPCVICGRSAPFTQFLRGSQDLAAGSAFLCRRDCRPPLRRTMTDAEVTQTRTARDLLEFHHAADDLRRALP